METDAVSGDVPVATKLQEQKSVGTDGAAPETVAKARDQSSDSEITMMDRILDLLHDMIMTFAVVLVGCQIHRWYSEK